MGVTIDTLKCVGCGACTLVCPVGVLMVEDDMKCHVSEGCISCGKCVPECNWKAIALEKDNKKVSKRGSSRRFTLKGGAPLSPKPPPLRRRRRGRGG